MHVRTQAAVSVPTRDQLHLGTETGPHGILRLQTWRHD